MDSHIRWFSRKLVPQGGKRGREEVTTASCLYSLTITYEVTKQTENLKLSEQQQFTATHKIFKHRGILRVSTISYMGIKLIGSCCSSLCPLL